MLSLSIQDAIALLRENGYRVTKPAAKAAKATARPFYNVLGKPMSASFEPDYRMKYKTPAPWTGPRHRVGSEVSPEQWAERCKDSAAAWQKFMAGEQDCFGRAIGGKGVLA